jgi:lipoprotein signal peptidase
MGLRNNPSPSWPSAPEDFVPRPGWPPHSSWPPPPASGKTSGWAIASFVFGLLGGVLLSVIFGVVALSRIKRLGQRGRGLTIAGLALSGAWVLLIAVILVVGSLGSATRSPTTGQITRSGSLSVFSLAVGDCFDNPAGATSVISVTAIPCDQAHNAQIYAEFNLAGSDQSYPGTAVVTRLATSGCNARAGRLDKSKVTNSMTIRILYPEADSWLNGDRTVACMVANPTATITSSLLTP